jgi:chloramphenicol 3-O phosphotransferase
MDVSRPGTIILLNGAASSGKTSIAQAIQHQFDEPYLHTGIDQFWGQMFPWGWPGAREELRWRDVPIPNSVPPQTATICPPFAQRMHLGIYHTAGALARLGLNVVVDHVLTEAAEVPELVAAWAGLPVWLIGVRCPLEILRERAAAREDRRDWQEYLNVVTWQHTVVHTHLGGYDLEVNTAELSPEVCARQMNELVQAGAPQAFARLRARA